MNDLVALTTLVNLLALAASLWLGLYIITRSPHSPRSRLAAVLLWTLDTYFICNTLLDHLPSNVFIAWMQQLVILAPPLALDLSVRLLPDEPSPRTTRLLGAMRYGVPVAYLVAIVLILSGVLPSNPSVNLLSPGGVAVPATGNLGLASQTASPLYPVFLLFLGLVSVCALLNLWQAGRSARPRMLSGPFTLFFAAMVIAGIGAVYSGLSTWFHLNTPTFPSDILYGISIVLMGYTVARYAALLEGRPMDRDFLYTLLVVGSLTAFYIAVVLVLYLGHQVSFVTLVLTIVGTIAANSLFDGVRVALDRYFYQGQFRVLRSSLRALAREAGTGGSLEERLAAILSSLCRVYRIQKGLIALRTGDGWTVAAAHEANPLHQVFPFPVLSARESVGMLHAESKGLGGMTLLIPLWASGDQIGAIVLGSKASRQPYGEGDMELLEDLGDEIIALIQAMRLQEENAQTINNLVQDFREKERLLQLQMQEMLAARNPEPSPAPTNVQEEELVHWVEDGLRHLYDFPYLGEHALARLAVAQTRVQAQDAGSITLIERGKAVNELLLEALQKLRPAGPEPRRQDIPPREWHNFVILNDSYVLGEPNRDITSRLYISEGTFNRTRRRALKSVAKALFEMEQYARPTT